MEWRDFIKNIVTFAYLRLVFESCTYCSEYVKTVEISSVSDIVYWYARMKKNSKCKCPFIIFTEYLVSNNNTILISYKWVLKAHLNFFMIDSMFFHLRNRTFFSEIATFHAILDKINSVGEPLDNRVFDWISL